MSSTTSREGSRRTKRRRFRSGRRVVVVGYDGSWGSKAALLRGAEQAGADGRLIVVQALSSPNGTPNVGAAVRSYRYAETVASLLSVLQAELPEGLRFEVRLVDGAPARALAETAHHHLTSHVVIGASTAGTEPEDSALAASLRALTSVPIVVVPAVPTASTSPRAREEPRVREQLARIVPGDRVDVYGDGSFPASDPPSSWAGPPRRPG